MSTDHKIQAEKSRVIILTREVLAWLLGDKGDDKAEHAEVVVRLGDEVVERAEVTFEEGDGTMGAFRITMRDTTCLEKVNALEAEIARLKMTLEGEHAQRKMQEFRAKTAEEKLEQLMDASKFAKDWHSLEDDHWRTSGPPSLIVSVDTLAEIVERLT